MKKIRFKSYDQSQLQLFPSRLDERISEKHPVRLINSIVDDLDLRQLIKAYKQIGCSPYSPRMLLKVVFYAYMNNIYSCRKIAKALDENVHFMWLSGKQYPSFSTINRFRSERLKNQINTLFKQVVLLLVDMGQISLNVSYLDGTKIESVANKYTFVWRKSVEKNKAKLETKIRSILEQIDEGIAQDNNDQDSDQASPIDSQELKERIKRLNESNKFDKKENKAEFKALKELEKHQAKLQEYEQKLDVLGSRNSYSKTDKDATFMRMKEDAMNNGQTKPGYNVQIGTENQYITNFGIYPNPGDTTTLQSFITLQMARLGCLPKEICADSGYGSEENYKILEDNNIEAYLKYTYFHKEQKRTYKNNPFLTDNLFYNQQHDFFVCPMGQHLKFCYNTVTTSSNGYKSMSSVYKASNCTGCPLRGTCNNSKENRIIRISHKLRDYKRRAREMLTSERGLYHRSNRPIEPEAVFGQMKFNMQYKRFRHRLFDKVQMDFGLFVMAFNLKKLAKRLLDGTKGLFLHCFFLVKRLSLNHNIYRSQNRQLLA